MSLMRSHRLLGLLLLSCTRTHTDQKVPFSTLFRTADTVIVGTIESSEPIQDSDGRPQMAPAPEEYGPVYWCATKIRVGALIKAQNPLIKVGGAVRVLWELPSASCNFYYGGESVFAGQPALWLLKTENGVLHTSLSDHALPVRPLLSFSQDIEHRLVEWREPRLAVTYLFLKPGVIIPEDHYARSHLQDQLMDVAGMADFLRVFRAVYFESNEHMRGQISLFASSFGHCLAAATRAAEGEGRLRDWAAIELSLNPEVERRTEVVQLRRMSWATKEELLGVFGGSPQKAVDELTFWACSSGVRVKTRARELLVKYFAIDPLALPCLPCE